MFSVYQCQRIVRPIAARRLRGDSELAGREEWNCEFIYYLVNRENSDLSFISDGGKFMLAGPGTTAKKTSKKNHRNPHVEVWFIPCCASLPFYVAGINSI